MLSVKQITWRHNSSFFFFFCQLRNHWLIKCRHTLAVWPEPLPHKHTMTNIKKQKTCQTSWDWRVQTCEMYPGGTWMGGIDPFGDIMGTSAGPAREEKNDHLHSSISSTHAGTQTQPHTQRARPYDVWHTLYCKNVLYSWKSTCIPTPRVQVTCYITVYTI